MRLAILADTHGNLPALEAVLEDIGQQAVDGFVVAGDITGGPQPQETIDLLRALDGWMVRGNSEQYVLDYDAGNVPDSWRVSDQWATMRWSCQRLDGETIDFLGGLPEQRVVALDGTAPIRVVHGSPRSPFEFLYPDRDPATLDVFRQADLLPADRELKPLEQVVAGVEEPVLVCAHSHISWVQADDGRLVINVGSVGAPNNGDARAQYALLAWQGGRWQATLRAVPYDLDRIQAAYRDTGLLAAGGVMAEAFLLGIVTGQNIPGKFVRHARRLAAATGYGANDVLPDDLWERAIATFDWGVQYGITAIRIDPLRG
jgi:predicted phosphodiesterase